MKPIGIGTKFNYTYADGNPEWTVTQNRGRGMWIATIKEDADWKGTTKAFSSLEIRQSLALADMWAESASESDKFFMGLTSGSIVHYRNGHNQYVRCKVTPTKELLPIALVGDWRAYDLPKRQRDGTVYNGYHADKVINGTVFRPHASNVWECNVAQKPNSQPIGFVSESNPNNMMPVMLTVPAMTPEQSVEAAKWRKIQQIQDVSRNNEMTADGILTMLKNILDDTAL